MPHRMFHLVLPRTVALVLGVACALALPASTARANAPAGRYTIANGTVTDNMTKLVWQQHVVSGGTWVQAKSYCAGLALAGGGWRVPSVKELMTLVDFNHNPNVAGAAIDETVFPLPSPATEPYWSSSLVSNDSTSAWGVEFSLGTTTWSGLGMNNLVRCVR